MNKCHSLRFYLDGELQQVDNLSPTTTVLQFLREHLGRMGTKEGCAEGDCGACTVVVAELEQGHLQYRAVNACIQFLVLLEGKALFTVESLKTKQGLHPVQQAMVDCHASQCGFCTPGFVMSLFALYQTQRHKPSRVQLNQTLSGNLCRCTGYRPILAAGQRMYDYPAVQQDSERLQNQLQALQAASASLAFQYQGQQLFAPQQLEEVSQLLQTYPQAQLLAGGTDIGLWVTKRLRVLAVCIYLGRVAALKQIKQTEQWLEIGAAVRLEPAFSALVQLYPSLASLQQRFASLPIRNSGTLVGNIANGSPIGDSMPALIALGASLVLRQGAQTRELLLEDFYLGYQHTALQPSEFIQAVRVPLPQVTQQLYVWKISKRFDQDISAVCAAFNVAIVDGVVQRVRIAFGGMAAIPKRALQCEQALQAQLWNTITLQAGQAALEQDFTPLSDMRASAAYRLQVAQHLLSKCFLQSTGQVSAADSEVLAWQETL